MPRLPKRQTWHSRTRVLQEALEQDHRGVKGRIRCMRGFKSFASAERFWVTSGKPMATLPRNGGKPLMSCLDANALR